MNKDKDTDIYTVVKMKRKQSASAKPIVSFGLIYCFCLRHRGYEKGSEWLSSAKLSQTGHSEPVLPLMDAVISENAEK